MKFALEEKAGGYVKNGDVLEWKWKDAPSEDEPEDKAPAKKESKKKG